MRWTIPKLSCWSNKDRRKKRRRERKKKFVFTRKRVLVGSTIFCVLDCFLNPIVYQSHTSKKLAYSSPIRFTVDKRIINLQTEMGQEALKRSDCFIIWYCSLNCRYFTMPFRVLWCMTNMGIIRWEYVIHFMLMHGFCGAFLPFAYLLVRNIGIGLYSPCLKITWVQLLGMIR